MLTPEQRKELDAVATLLVTIRNDTILSAGDHARIARKMQWLRERLTEAVGRINMMLDVCEECGGMGEVKTCTHQGCACPCPTEPCGC